MLVSIKEGIFLVSPFSLFSDFSTLKIRRLFHCPILRLFDTDNLPSRKRNFFSYQSSLKAHISKNHKPLNMQTHFDKNLKSLE